MRAARELRSEAHEPAQGGQAQAFQPMPPSHRMGQGHGRSGGRSVRMLGHAGGATAVDPMTMTQQEVWQARRDKAKVVKRWRQWEMCEDAETGDVFYFNNKTQTGVLHAEQADDETVLELSQAVRGREEWVREDPGLEQTGTAKAWRNATRKFVKQKKKVRGRASS